MDNQAIPQPKNERVLFSMQIELPHDFVDRGNTVKVEPVFLPTNTRFITLTKLGFNTYALCAELNPDDKLAGFAIIATLPGGTVLDDAQYLSTQTYTQRSSGLLVSGQAEPPRIYPVLFTLTGASPEAMESYIRKQEEARSQNEQGAAG